MTVTPDTVVVGVEPDISGEKFNEVLVLAGSPSRNKQGYLDIVHHRVSVAFALAIFKHESRFGTAGLVSQYDLKNPGATRSTRTGEGTVIPIPGRGPFVRYPSWATGWADLAYRLVDKSYVYHRENRRTIRQIIERWAPPEDNNNPDSYVNAVVRSMNEWIEDAPVDLPQIQIPGVEVEWYVWETEDDNGDKTKHVGADSKHHTKGRTHPVRQIVHHHSDGWDSRNWLTHTSPNNVSAHFLVNHEGTKVWQLVRLEDTAHTQGNQNPWSVGIEWERKWPDQEKVPEKVYDTLAKLDAAIMDYVVDKSGIGNIKPNREDILRHGEVNNTACPQNLDVDRIVQLVREQPLPGTNIITFDTGYPLQHGFADFYRSVGDNAWRTIGVPIGNEEGEIDNGEGLVTVQRTDVGWLQYNPATGEIRMATRDQQRAIEQDLGISTDTGLTLERQREIGELLVRTGNELRLN